MLITVTEHQIKKWMKEEYMCVCVCVYSPLPHHRATRTYTGLGKQTLGGLKQTLCTPGPRRKEH